MINRMRRRSSLLAMAIVGAFTLAASAKSDEGTHHSVAEAALLAAEDQRFDAQVAHDVKALAAEMADELVYTHATGRRQTKSEYLRDFESGHIPYRSIKANDRSARVFGAVGITRGVLHMLVGDKDLYSTYLGVYVKRDGRWRLLDWQSSPSPQGGELGPAK